MSLFQFLKEAISQNILVHVYSYPQFAIEGLMGIVMCLVHCLLIMDVGNAFSRSPPLKLHRRKSAAAVDSRSSNITTVVRNHPDFGVEVVFNENSLLRNDWDTVSRINKMLSTSLSEYVRRDLNKMKSGIPIECLDEEILDVKLRPSMEEICDYLVKQREMRQKLQTTESSVKT